MTSHSNSIFTLKPTMSTTMITDGPKQRHPPASVLQMKKEQENTTESTEMQHPGGAIKHSPWQQALRMALLALYFHGCCFLCV